MELRVLRYFLAVAEEGNITWAAQLLRISQPTLSRQLKQLEGELGVTLFERGSHTITLTEEGQPVAELGPVRMSTYQQLRDLGLERPAMADLDAYQMPSKNLPDGRGIVGKLQD